MAKNQNKKTDENKEPVTLVFSWKVKTGKEKEFEKWAHEITKAADTFEGHLGANWIKAPNNQNYTLIYKFDTIDNFRKWEQSEIRKHLLKRGLDLTTQEKPQKIQQLTGLETWFTLPGTMTVKPPPRWKMLVTTMIGIYPLGLLLQVFLFPHLMSVPIYIRPIFLTIFITPLMTYVVMPNLTTFFKKWLYPEK
jgi:antibiotic biosynthesis monooxygenase (ABM) superfamily enzyme